MLSLLLPLALLSMPNTAGQVFQAPDGHQEYFCTELQQGSAAGCYTHWTRTIHINGRAGDWTPAICGDTWCNQGGVPWWWWKEGKLGDPVLKDFWIRDYRRPNNNNPYGDARRLPGKTNCYSAKERIICMEQMKDPARNSNQNIDYLTKTNKAVPVK